MSYPPDKICTWPRAQERFSSDTRPLQTVIPSIAEGLKLTDTTWKRLWDAQVWGSVDSAFPAKPLADISPHVPTNPVQTRQEQLSNEVRATIRENRDVHDALLDLERQPQPKEIHELIAEALQDKGLGDRCNILLYAASMGKDVSFTSAVRAVGERVSDGDGLTRVV